MVLKLNWVKKSRGWLVGVWDGNSWDPSQLFWDLEWSSHQNPNKWNVERCSIKLPNEMPQTINQMFDHLQNCSLSHLLVCTVECGWCWAGLTFIQISSHSGSTHSNTANALLTGYRQVFPCVTRDNCTHYSFSWPVKAFWSKCSWFYHIG